MRPLPLLLLLALILAWPATACAYLDPGTGSLLLQILLGGVAGVAVAVRLFWHKLSGLFSRRKNGDERSPD